MSYTFRIKEILDEKKMLQKDLASLLNIEPVTLSQNLSRNPTMQTLIKIATALDVEVYELFDNAPRQKECNNLVCPHCHNKINIEIK